MRAIILFGASLLGGILQCLYHYFHLPPRVALHFGNNGMADNWGSREMNLILNLVFYLFFAVLWLSIPFIFKKLPKKLISFPHKDYWLAPERIDRTLEEAGGRFLVMGTATNLFFGTVSHLTFMANKISPPRINEACFLFVMGCYLLFIAVWTVLLYRQYGVLPESEYG